MKKRYISAHVKDIDADQKSVTVIASSAAVDREGDSINPDGWDFTNFLNNPVLLWSHDAYSLPIGRVNRIWVENGNVMAQVQFAEEEREFAAEVARLVRGRYLNAVSVGFLPTEMNSMGQVTKQEMLELSFVNIPANQEALVTERTGDKQAVVKMKSFAELEQKVLKELKPNNETVAKTKAAEDANYPATLASCVAAMNEISKQVKENVNDAAMTRGLLEQMWNEINKIADCVVTWQSELGADAASAKSLEELRLKVGRTLSERNRNEIRLMVDACKQAAESGTKLLDSTEPPEKKGDELTIRKAVKPVDAALRALRIQARATEILILRKKEELATEKKNGGDIT